MACIFGKSLGGSVGYVRPKQMDTDRKISWIKIFNFKCLVLEKADGTLETSVHNDYSSLELHGEVGDGLMGNRQTTNGIIEPADNYIGPDYITKVKPKKATEHTTYFSVKANKFKAAICHYDNLQTNTALQKVGYVRNEIGR